MPSPLLTNGPLELLYEERGLPSFDLGARLREAYGGGSLGFERPALIANFVSSVDGVVALPSGGESGMVISQSSAADHFVMGLLRMVAGAVVVGASTLRRSPGHRWTAEAIYGPAAADYASTRRALGLSPQPTFVVVSASGNIDTSQPALENAIVVTTGAGAALLESRARSHCRVIAFEGARVDMKAVLRTLRSEGHELVLTEGGPSLFAELLHEGLVDELFLTTSPVLFGRYASDQRKSLAEGLDLAGTALELRSLRRHGSHLFHRYRLKRDASDKESASRSAAS